MAVYQIRLNDGESTKTKTKIHRKVKRSTKNIKKIKNQVNMIMTVKIEVVAKNIKNIVNVINPVMNQVRIQRKTSNPIKCNW